MKITFDSSSPCFNDKEAQTRSKLTDAAQQFEAMLLQEMLKPLRLQAGSWSDGEETEGASDTISSFGTEAVAKAVSREGGLGVARQVIRQVSAENEKLQRGT